MKISICFGTFNRLQYLKSNVEMIVKDTKQDSLNIEICIADGGSIDGTTQYLKSIMSDNIKPILLEKRTGYSYFMNACIKKSTGELMVQWNDDAYMCPGGWKKYHDIAAKDLKSTIVGHRFPHATIDCPIGSVWEQKLPQWKFKNGIPIALGNHLMCFGAYYRTSLKKCGAYHPSIYFYHCDTELCQRMMFLNGRQSLPWVPECKVHHLGIKKARKFHLSDSQSRRDEGTMSRVLTAVRRGGKPLKETLFL